VLTSGNAAVDVGPIVVMNAQAVERVAVNVHKTHD
jgi:hypothetical protein